MSRKLWDDPEMPQTKFVADYVVEWYVENDAGRYKRLSMCGVPSLEEPIYDQRGKKTASVKLIPTHAVVCAVLEVPLPKLEGVTNQLRQSTKLRSSIPYLASAAAAADSAAEMRDRLAQLEIENKALRKLARSLAKTCDQVNVVEDILVATKQAGRNEVKAMHDALDEKRAEVAAKLLANMPDGDW